MKQNKTIEQTKMTISLIYMNARIRRLQKIHTVHNLLKNNYVRTCLATPGRRFKGNGGFSDTQRVNTAVAYNTYFEKTLQTHF